MKSKQVLVLEYVFIVLLGVLMSLGYIFFVITNNFAPAGINGIAVMVQYKLNFSVGFMSLIINIPLCVFAFFFVNRKFAVRTLVFCLVYSFSYLFLQKLDLSRFQYNANGVDTIYPVLIAGLISGFCYGCLFRLNSSSGGTDVVAKFVSKKKPFLNFFWITFAINAVVTFASYFVYAENVNGVVVYNYKPVCLCMLYCFMSSFVGNVMLKGSRSACEFVIVTTRADEIEQLVLKTLHHSATRLKGQGIYSGTDKEVLICVVNRHQMVEFQDMIRRFPDTFTFINTVDDTVGNFKKIK